MVVTDRCYCITLYASFYWHIKCHREKLKYVCRHDHLKQDPQFRQKHHFWTKPYHVTPVAINVANPIIFYMSLLPDMSPWYSRGNLKERIWLLPRQEILKFTSREPGQNQAVILCNDCMGIFSFSFGPWLVSTGFCNIGSCKIIPVMSQWALWRLKSPATG